MDITALTSAVIDYAGKQHEDSAWDQVYTAMTRADIAEVIVKAGARSRKQAIRALRHHLADQLDDSRALVLA